MGQHDDQLLCTHEFVRTAPREGFCLRCGLDYREYVTAQVRAQLSRMGMWDD